MQLWVCGTQYHIPGGYTSYIETVCSYKYKYTTAMTVIGILMLINDVLYASVFLYSVTFWCAFLGIQRCNHFLKEL